MEEMEDLAADRKLRGNDLSLRGAWIEALFAATALRHRLEVLRPWWMQGSCDLGAGQKNGRLWRVQVKSTDFWLKGNYICRLASQNGYLPKGIDFFAAYVIPADAWYIIPFVAVQHIRIAISLNPHRPDNKYYPYLGAWHLLRDDGLDRGLDFHCWASGWFYHGEEGDSRIE